MRCSKHRSRRHAGGDFPVCSKATEDRLVQRFGSVARSGAKPSKIFNRASSKSTWNRHLRTDPRITQDLTERPLVKTWSHGHAKTAANRPGPWRADAAWPSISRCGGTRVIRIRAFDSRPASDVSCGRTCRLRSREIVPPRSRLNNLTLLEQRYTFPSSRRI